MGGQRLSAAAVGAAPARRSARRPFRAAAAAGHRHQPFRARRRWSARWRRACRCCSPRARLQGIGAALLLPNSLALLNAAFQGEKRGRAVGIWAAAGAAAAAVAPLIGGWLVGNVGWPAIFYINLPLALGAILLALRFVAESREPGGGRTDYAGALLATAGLGGADLRADPVVGDRPLHRPVADRARRWRCAARRLPVVEHRARQSRDDAARAVRRTAASPASTC